MNKDLKFILMELGNRLVLDYRFEPSTGSGDKCTQTIRELTEFINKSPEAQDILNELGYEWSM